MSTTRTVRKLRARTRLGKQKLRTRLASDRWGSRLIRFHPRERIRQLACDMKQQARHALQSPRAGATVAVLLAIGLCAGLRLAMPSGVDSIPASASAAPQRLTTPPEHLPPRSSAPAPARLAASSASGSVSPAAAKSPAVPQVHGELTRLKLAYQAARERCLLRLYNTPQYRAARNKLDQLDQHVRQLRVNDPQGELILVSPKWIEAKSDLIRITQGALESDPEVQSAAQALQARGLKPE